MFASEVLNRAFLSTGIILTAVGTYSLYNSTIRYRFLIRDLLVDLGPIQPLAFILVYFTTPTCVPCKTIQRPAIQRLNLLLDNALQVIEIDATERPELAARWGVLSVRTTFLINPRGELRHVNHAVVRAEQLLMQIFGGT